MDKEEQARATTAFNAGVDETNRRERGNFDELLGQFPKESSELLRAIVSTLRDYLLDRYSDDDARRLLRELEPRAGYGNGIILPADVVLAGTLFNSIRGAARCDGERFDLLVWGLAGARDLKRQAGTRKEKRPDIMRWIKAQLARNPDAKSPYLWSIAPQYVTDQIESDRFGKRVTACRKAVASK